MLCYFHAKSEVLGITLAGFKVHDGGVFFNLLWDGTAYPNWLEN